MKKDYFGYEQSSIVFFNRRISIYWIFLWGIAIYFIITSIINTINNHNLIKCGIETKAIVIDVRKVGSKGVVLCTYEFKANNMLYTGTVADDYYLEGDTIVILYSKGKPVINRDKKFLMK